MQKTLLIGYLGKDPEMKYSPGGTAITTFTIASTERWKDSAGEPQEHTELFNIKTFGKRAIREASQSDVVLLREVSQRGTQ